MTVSKRAVGLRGVGLAAYLTITAPASKIARQAVHFPIPVTHRLQPAAPVDFRRGQRCFYGRAPGGGFRKGAACLRGQPPGGSGHRGWWFGGGLVQVTKLLQAHYIRQMCPLALPGKMQHRIVRKAASVTLHCPLRHKTGWLTPAVRYFRIT